MHRPDEGEILLDGAEVTFTSPRNALNRGIATVYQDLATLPLMSVARNCFVGREPTVGRSVLRRLDWRRMNRVAVDELAKMGIRNPRSGPAVGTLSGGERQSLAIARAVYFGARVLILDEPTSALGVHQASVVLRLIARARNQGLGVVFSPTTFSTRFRSAIASPSSIAAEAWALSSRMRSGATRCRR